MPPDGDRVVGWSGASAHDTSSSGTHFPACAERKKRRVAELEVTSKPYHDVPSATGWRSVATSNSHTSPSPVDDFVTATPEPVEVGLSVWSICDTVHLW